MMVPRNDYQEKVDVLYTDFIGLELFSRTTKVVVCILGGTIDGCTDTMRLLVHNHFNISCVQSAAEMAVSEELLDMIGLRRCSTCMWLYF